MRTLRVVVLALSAACSSATGPVSIGGVIADAKLGAIFIQNRTSQPVYTFVVGRNASALVDWIACSDPAKCAAIHPGQTRTEPYPQGVVAQNETEALVYWWHIVPNGAVFKPDSIRVGVVRLD